MNETAGQLIKDALTELTIQAQEQSVPAIDVNTGIRYLNRMMLMLDGRGVKLGYTLVQSSSDALTTPQGAYEGMMFNLALRLASGFDVAVSPALGANARESLKTMFLLGVSFNNMKYPETLPIGSGNDFGDSEDVYSKFFEGNEGD